MVLTHLNDVLDAADNLKVILIELDQRNGLLKSIAVVRSL